MKGNRKYYKICYPTSIIMFYHDFDDDKLDGIIEERKTDDTYVLRKHFSLACYNQASNNTLCMSMILKAKEITRSEYETAREMVNLMIDKHDWLIGENEIEPKQVVTETVYV